MRVTMPLRERGSGAPSTARKASLLLTSMDATLSTDRGLRARILSVT